MKSTRELLSPFQRFLKVESLSGVLLFGAAIIAMVWANSPFRDSYHALWEFKVGVGSDAFALSKPLLLWINDGLMTIFFFLIGLEIKRELLIGELDSMKKAALPLFGAVGGMVFPVALFLILNQNPASETGWGVPMATDIAFTLAILRVLGSRVPLSLKVFLTAFAIVDDLGAVIVIAVFYSSGVDLALIGYALVLLLLLWVLSTRGVYIKYLTFVAGAVIWFLFLKSGIHPTIAGVLVAFTIPIRQKIQVAAFREQMADITRRIEQTPANQSAVLSKGQIAAMDSLEELMGQVQSPLQHLEHKLHQWVAYLVIPMFALANAGVSFSMNMDLDLSLVLSIALSLLLGKAVGITLMSVLGVKLRIAVLPPDMNLMHIVGVSVLAGVGFTMSIFISHLAFSGEVLVDSAKVGIIGGSLVAGIIGFVILRLVKVQDHPDQSLQV